MALRKKIVRLVFAKGINTGKDPKVLSTELMRLENGRLDRIGAITKRYGTTSVSTYSEQFMSKLAERPLLIDNKSLRVWDGATATSGSFDAVDSTMEFGDVAETPICAEAGNSHYLQDLCVNGNVETVVYSNAHPAAITSYAYAVCVKTFDATTHVPIASSWVARAGIRIGARMTTSGANTLVWFVDPQLSPVRVQLVVVNNVGAIAAAVDPEASLPNGLSSNLNLDAVELNDADSTTMVSYVNYAGYLTTFTYKASGFVWNHNINDTVLNLAVYKHGTDVGMVVYDNGIGATKVIAYNHLCAIVGDNGAGAAVTAFTTTTPYMALGMTGIYKSAGKSWLYFTEEDNTGAAPRQLPNIRRGELTITGTTISVSTAPIVFMRGVRLASRPFSEGTTPYIMVHFRPFAASGGDDDGPAASQSVYFFVDSTGRPFAQAFRDAAGPVIVDFYAAQLPRVVQTAAVISPPSTTWVVLGLRWEGNELNSLDTKLLNPSTSDSISFHRLTLTIGAPSSLQCQEENGVLHIPNSVPYLYDGASVVEDGWLAYPESLVIAESNTATGALVLGQKYGYCACYEWPDKQGNVHRSSPSPPISKTITGSNDTLTVSVPMLMAPDGTAAVFETLGYMTRKVGARVVLYRTDGNGSVYYRLASASVTSCTTGRVAFIDHGCAGLNGVEVYFIGAIGVGPSYTGVTTSLLGTSGAPTAYVTGGVCVNTGPASYRISCQHQSRLFTVDRERESTDVLYTKYLRPGDGPGWGLGTIVVPEAGGAITGLASFQDRLIVFKAHCAYVAYGNGLSDTLAGSDYVAPLLLSPGLGCISPKSILLIPDGVVFLSHAGLACVRQDFTIDPDFGLPVQFHTDTLTVSSAALIADLGYAIWTTTAGLALVYNYGTKQWSTFTNHEATDAVEAGGVLYRHVSTYVRIEDRSVFKDDSALVSMKLVTGHMPVEDEIDGFGRLYSILLVGQNISPHTLVCWPRFDLDAVWDAADKVTFDANALGSAFDIASYYTTAGLAATYADKGYELVAGTRREKMRTLQVQVYDDVYAGTTVPAEGYSISEMFLLVGVRDPWLRKATAREMS